MFTNIRQNLWWRKIFKNSLLFIYNTYCLCLLIFIVREVCLRIKKMYWQKYADWHYIQKGKKNRARSPNGGECTKSAKNQREFSSTVLALSYCLTRFLFALFFFFGLCNDPVSSPHRRTSHWVSNELSKESEPASNLLCYINFICLFKFFCTNDKGKTRGKENFESPRCPLQPAISYPALCQSGLAGQIRMKLDMLVSWWLEMPS